MNNVKCRVFKIALLLGDLNMLILENYERFRIVLER